ncbi:alpha/beta fold hydrolase [Allokutzneria sp. A3M-2-11 16]|uniref:esterase/lipase family protein n=1 Tax=Allokutzneria sp. A3M-2-11 16 TaxID=2962043 RepID=UPI0020B76686|nr:alpha/beta fold hydrolase [Allokutzneria sp. A3M-2-11 16]MCP3803179.1 alpha/beta fold hydrolase [Allokutzneria sp. A3M-2-11 16]
MFLTRWRTGRLLLAVMVATGVLTGGSASGAVAAQRNPVILVHGWMSNSWSFHGMVEVLRGAGYPVYAMDLPGQDNLVNAHAVASLVDEVAERHGSKVHLVGHSMGGLSTRHYLKFLGGVGQVGHYVSMGSPQYGSREACLLPDLLGGQMCFSSRFLAELNTGDDTPGSVRYTTIRSTLDVPAEANRLDGGACFHDIPDVRHADEPSSPKFSAAVLMTIGGICPGRFVVLPPLGDNGNRRGTR